MPAYAEKIKAIEQAKARGRMAFGGKGGLNIYSEAQGTGNCPYLTQAEARSEIAKKVGFSSDRQMRRAKTIAEQRPDLLREIDSGETTIYGAYRETVKEGNGNIQA